MAASSSAVANVGSAADDKGDVVNWWKSRLAEAVILLQAPEPGEPTMTLINELVVEFLDVLNTLGHRFMGGPLSALCKTYFEHDPLFYEYQTYFLED
jgi:hypothetical protein